MGGAFSTQLVVSVVGNAPKYATSFGPIATMQEMTSGICSGIATGTEGTLTDTRDNTEYYVGKMLDGKCWMLQNLALGKTDENTTLTSADSDVSSNWTLSASYSTATNGSSAVTAIQSWNFGKWVLATPLLTTSCGNSGSIPTPSNCIKVGFVDVSDATNFQPTYTATTGTWNGATVTNNTLVAVNCTTWSGSGTSRTCSAGTYDPHYLVGNYYSWNAATAGTGGSITSGEASGSICPKGWELPTSNSTATGSFAGLLSQYGVSSSLSGTANGTTYNIAGAPLRFVRGGYLYPGNRLSGAGSFGYYRSSTPSSGGDAYGLHFNTGVNPSNNYYRYVGQSVRCINDDAI